MLKIRIIPTMLWKDVGLVKGVHFDSKRRVGSIIPAIKVYNLRQVDELVLLDITATKNKRRPDIETVAEVSPECFCPLTVGGGVKSIEDVELLLRAGADKVAINSAAYENPDLIQKGAKFFGSQCVVASVDAKKINGEYVCFSDCGTKNRKIKVENWVKKLEELGAGEILITSVDRDGTMKGYDIDLIKLVSDSVQIPVIASGGAGKYEDFYKAIKMGKCSGVAAASVFHFTEMTPMAIKKYLSSKNIPVRLPVIL